MPLDRTNALNLSPGRIRLIAVIIGSALFMEQLDVTILTTALPTMARELQVSPLHMSLALTSYLLSLAIFIPVSAVVADRVGTLPGVVAAGFVDYLPLSADHSDTFVRIPGWAGDRDPGYDADIGACTPDWFRAMGIPLKAGRFFDARDLAPDRRVAIINEAMVRACFPDANPLGRQLVYQVHPDHSVVCHVACPGPLRRRHR